MVKTTGLVAGFALAIVWLLFYFFGGAISAANTGIASIEEALPPADRVMTGGDERQGPLEQVRARVKDPLETLLVVRDDASKGPVSGAVIDLIEIQDRIARRVRELGRSDEKGVFRLTPASTLTLRVSHPGYASVVLTAVEAGTRMEVPLGRAAAIRFRVRDFATSGPHRPVVGYAVQLTGCALSAPSHGSTHTRSEVEVRSRQLIRRLESSDNGMIEFSDLRPGTYSWMAENDDVVSARGVPRMVEVKGGELREITLDLVPVRVCGVRVLGDDVIHHRVKKGSRNLLAGGWALSDLRRRIRAQNPGCYVRAYAIRPSAKGLIVGNTDSVRVDLKLANKGERSAELTLQRPSSFVPTVVDTSRDPVTLSHPTINVFLEGPGGERFDGLSLNLTKKGGKNRESYSLSSGAASPIPVGSYILTSLDPGLMHARLRKLLDVRGPGVHRVRIVEPPKRLDISPRGLGGFPVARFGMEVISREGKQVCFLSVPGGQFRGFVHPLADTIKVSVLGFRPMVLRLPLVDRSPLLKLVD